MVNQSTIKVFLQMVTFFTGLLMGVGKSNIHAESLKNSAESKLILEKQQFLDILLSAQDDQIFDKQLLIYGPIRETDIPFLFKNLKSPNEMRRHHAIQLLSIAPKSFSQPVLKKVALESNDPYLFAVALEAFLDQPDGKIIAKARSTMVVQALESNNPDILSVGLQAGVLLGLPQIDRQLEHGLDHPSEKVHEAVLKILATHPIYSLEPKLKDILLHKTEKREYSPYMLYQILSLSDDPSMAQVFRKSLEDGDISQKLDFISGIFRSKSRKSWLRDLLLDLAQHPGYIQSSAFFRLEEWGSELTPKLARICIDIYENGSVPDHGIGYECVKFASQLSGKPSGLELTKENILFLKEWLSTQGNHH